jgi:hypothetical protein
MARKGTRWFKFHREMSERTQLRLPPDGSEGISAWQLRLKQRHASVLGKQLPIYSLRISLAPGFTKSWGRYPTQEPIVVPKALVNCGVPTAFREQGVILDQAPGTDDVASMRGRPVVKEHLAKYFSPIFIDKVIHLD